MRRKISYMLTFIIIFLLSACVMLTAALAVSVSRQERARKAEEKYNEALTTYNKELIKANTRLSEDVKKLTSENDILQKKITVIENLHKINWARYALNKTEQEEAETEQPKQKADEEKHIYERLPENISTNTISYEDFKFVIGSEQAKLQEKCATDLSTGIRVFKDLNGDLFYCAALGGAYGGTIGNAFEFTLNCGAKIKVIMSDYKSPEQGINPNPYDFGHKTGTDGKPLANYDGEAVVNIIEFICDTALVHKAVRDAGTFTVLEKFGGLYGNGGNIVDVKFLGRKWEP